MEEDWEQIADAEEVPIPPVKPNVNKWDGEDEEEDVKDNWEDEDEEKKDEEKLQTPVNNKPKKTLEQKLAEKELLKQEQLRREAEREEELAQMTPEEKLAEKLRIQKLQEESDLKTALETFGIAEKGKGIDGASPTTKEEFFELAESISKKVQQYKNDEEYINFIEELVRNVCASLSSNNIRKIKTTIDNLFLEKQKVEKGDKPKKAKGGKLKARLRIEGENMTKVDEYTNTKYDDYDEYDDFM